jgi:hypothetical protein
MPAQARPAQGWARQELAVRRWARLVRRWARLVRL